MATRDEDHWITHPNNGVTHPVCVRLHQIDGGEMRLDLYLDQASDLAAFLAAGDPGGPRSVHIETLQGRHCAKWTFRRGLCFRFDVDTPPAFMPEDSAKRLGAAISAAVSTCVSMTMDGVRRRTDDNLRGVFG